MSTCSRGERIKYWENLKENTMQFSPRTLSVSQYLKPTLSSLWVSRQTCRSHSMTTIGLINYIRKKTSPYTAGRDLILLPAFSSFLPVKIIHFFGERILFYVEYCLDFISYQLRFLRATKGGVLTNYHGTFSNSLSNIVLPLFLDCRLPSIFCRRSIPKSCAPFSFYLSTSIRRSNWSIDMVFGIFKILRRVTVSW